MSKNCIAKWRSRWESNPHFQHPITFLPLRRRRRYNCILALSTGCERPRTRFDTSRVPTGSNSSSLRSAEASYGSPTCSHCCRGRRNNCLYLCDWQIRSHLPPRFPLYFTLGGSVYAIENSWTINNYPMPSALAFWVNHFCDTEFRARYFLQSVRTFIS